MLSGQNIQNLLHRPAGDAPVASFYLDLSVNSDNKRTHGVFLNKLRHRFDHERLKENGGKRSFDAALDRVERWLEDEFDESNRGAALFVQLDGGWFEALQLPDPVENSVALNDAPVLRPLMDVLERENRHTVVLVDREHLRLFDVQFGRVTHEHELETAPYPAAHDVQAGGYSQRDYQSRKAEEARQFLKDFVEETEAFVERYQPIGLILLGTDENVGHFQDALPQGLQDRVVHRAHAPHDATGPEILERLEDWFEQAIRDRRQERIELLHDRIDHQHYAVGGIRDTLDQLQRGKVATLVVDRALQRTGARCTQCGVHLDRARGECPYCSGETRDGVDLVEAMVRSAVEQDADVHLVPTVTVAQYEGVGALLRF